MKKAKVLISKILNHKIFLIIVVIICLYTQGRQSDKNFGWTNPKNTNENKLKTILSDGSGYYAYLPTWFIYGNNSQYSYMTSIVKKYKTNQFNIGLGYNYQKKHIYNKYYIGTSICITPFFFNQSLHQ